MEQNTIIGRALVKISAKIEKNTLCGRALVSIRVKIEKNTLCGWTLVRIRENSFRIRANKKKLFW